MFYLPLISSFQPFIVMQPIWSAIFPQDFDLVDAQTLAKEKKNKSVLALVNIG